jgi:hypothetical protein
MIENLLVRGRMLAIRHTRWRNLVRAATAPKVAQEKVLKTILRENCDTQYGELYHFGAISSYPQFARHVPVVTYETLRPYIEAQLRNGSAALTTAAPVMYATTSGTTGEPKYVPITRAELEQQKQHTTLLTYSQHVFNPLAFGGKVWVMAASAVEGRFENGIPWGSASGFLYASMSPAIANKYLIPPEVFSIADNGLKYDLILRLALAEKNISYFSAANPTTLLRLCTLANQQGMTVAGDVERGKFSRASELDPKVLRAIRGRLSANAERAAELRGLFGTGKEVTFGDLWPALQMVSTWTGGNCAVAVRSASVLLPASAKIVELGYLSSEFCGTLTVDCNVVAGMPNITSYFYEFIEPEKWDAGSREFRLVHQLESGREYYVVVTTPSGLYRYFINDIVRAEGSFYDTPLIRFVQKGKGVTNITGEKLYESQITEAMGNAEAHFGFRAIFHLVLADVEQQIYRVFLEADQIQAGAEKTAEYVDGLLSMSNSEYRAKRESGRLYPLTVTFLKPGTGEMYRAHCIKSGQKDGQFKMVTLQYAHQCQFIFQPYNVNG